MAMLFRSRTHPCILFEGLKNSHPAYGSNTGN